MLPEIQNEFTSNEIVPTHKHVNVLAINLVTLVARVRRNTSTIFQWKCACTDRIVLKTKVCIADYYVH